MIQTTTIRRNLFMVTLFLLVFSLESASFAVQLGYSTFLRGSSDTSYCNSVAVDTAGNIYVIGVTAVPSFPVTTTGYDTSYNGGGKDLFVCKINPNLSGSSSLLYSTFLGGSNQDEGQGISVDNAGNIYITGFTLSSNFPITSNALDTIPQSLPEVFVCILNPSLSGISSLVYSTFLGGSADEEGYGISIDSAGNVYVTGYTNSFDFPTTSNSIPPNVIGLPDVFVVKINPSLSGSSSLLYSTYLGGAYNDGALAIASDKSGKIYVTGYTLSSTFPTTSNAYDTSANGGYDIFFSKIDPTLSGLSSLVYSTYIGGTQHDQGHAIAVDSSGNAYITGYTYSSTFPVTSNSFDTVPIISGYHAFVSKINPSLSGISSLTYSTYLKGDSAEVGQGITASENGNVYVTGYTWSSYFPITPNAYDTTLDGADDVFVTQLNPGLPGASALIYSTFIGGFSFDVGNGIAIDSIGRVYVCGVTYSNTYPTTVNALETVYQGYTNAFVTRLDINTVLPVEDWMMYSLNGNIRK